MPSATDARVIWAFIVGAFLLAVAGAILTFWYISIPLAALVIFLVVWRRHRLAASASASSAPIGATAVRSTEPQQGSLSDHAAQLVEACRLIVESQFGSTSMLQRKLGIAFADAGVLLDELETYAVVGPINGSKARDVLLSPRDLPAALDRIRNAAS
ncbi:MAG: cell division protein FtsK [Rhodoglobus sp.]|nr:cell division protein FtsK [Rhodoglobus sp.]